MLIVIVGLAVVFATADGRRTKLLAASVAALVAIDTINAAGGVAFGTSGLGSIIGTLFTRDSLTSLAWLSGIAALVFLRRGDRQAFTLAAATAWVITVTSGLSDLGVFGQSVIPSKLDPNVVRAYTALTIGIGLALSITAGLHAWQTRSSPAAPTPTKGRARRRR